MKETKTPWHYDVLGSLDCWILIGTSKRTATEALLTQYGLKNSSIPQAFLRGVCSIKVVLTLIHTESFPETSK